MHEEVAFIQNLIL